MGSPVSVRALFRILTDSDMKHIVFVFMLVAGLSLPACTFSGTSSSEPFRAPVRIPALAACFAPDGPLHAGLVPIVSGVASPILCLVVLWIRTERRLRRSRRVADERLRLLRTLLDLHYTYRNSPEVFAGRFGGQVHVSRLKSYALFEASPRRFAALREEERLLCVFIEAGFTPRELCSVFGLKTTGNVHTKYRRILRKLGAREPDRRLGRRH